VSQGLPAKEHLLPKQPTGLPHGLGLPTLGNVIFQHALYAKSARKAYATGAQLGVA
jgi:hypothetical protein